MALQVTVTEDSVQAGFVSRAPRAPECRPPAFPRTGVAPTSPAGWEGDTPQWRRGKSAGRSVFTILATAAAGPEVFGSGTAVRSTSTTSTELHFATWPTVGRTERAQQFRLHFMCIYCSLDFLCDWGNKLPVRDIPRSAGHSFCAWHSTEWLWNLLHDCQFYVPLVHD